MKENQVHISVIVPVFNASQHIEYFYTCLSAALIKIGRNFETIFINDGSSDSTLEKLTWLSERDSSLRLINQPCNLGQYSAINKGISQARGEILVIMDDDQEYALKCIPIFLKRIADGDDLVLGWRIKRDIPLWRMVGSQVTNLMISAVLCKRIHDLGGTKVFGNKGARALGSCGSLLKVIKSYRQLRISQVRMNDTSCRVSRYNLKKSLWLFLQVIGMLLNLPERNLKGKKIINA